MTQYKTLNVKLSNLQLNNLKSQIKDGTEVTLKISSNVAGDSNNENNFPHKLLLNFTQVSKLRKAFSNNSTANIKFLKTQLLKIGQSGVFLGRLVRPILKIGLSLIGNVLKPWTKRVLIPSGSTSAASAIDAAMHRKMFGSVVTTLIVSNAEMNNIIKIVKSLEEWALLIKGVSETINIESKKQKGGFPGMLLGTLGASLLGNLLTGKGTVRPSVDTTGAGEGIIRSGYNF